MCGILGIFNNNRESIDYERFEYCLNLLKKRGPDDDRIKSWYEDYGSLVFGHTRLSIIDLTKNGSQPMTCSNNNYSLVFNGEIYNYKELRKHEDLSNYEFISDSDSEVLLAAWSVWQEKCISKLVGMFSFAIFDNLRKKLFLVRDAYGIKPLYYYYDSNKIIFSSEIKSIRKLNSDLNQINYQSSYNYLISGLYENSEQTFFKKVNHLEAGEIITFNLDPLELSNSIKWWNPKLSLTSHLDFDEAVELFKEEFLNSINLHLRSDVPIGVTLSGGIDSSSIACSIRNLFPDIPINTFTFIADEKCINEENWADIVNKEIRANSYQVKIKSSNFIDDIEEIIALQGEPFVSTSIYAQFCVYREAKQQGIKVLLEGQGADELLAGYFGYPGARTLSMIESKEFKELFKYINNIVKLPDVSLKLILFEIFQKELPDILYYYARKIIGRNYRPAWLNLDSRELENVYFGENRYKKNKDLKGRRLIESLHEAITGSGIRRLLRHADRSSMYFGIEARVPFLNTRLSEFIYSLPENYLINTSGSSKLLLKEAMKNILPNKIYNRSDKIGFDTPQKKWIKDNHNYLRSRVIEWAHKDPMVNHKKVEILFDYYIKANKNYKQLWRWINYAIWYDQINN